MTTAITIVVADDNSYMRETLRFLISRVDNFQLIGEALSGVEAIKLTKELCPDILLLDINMAPINGFEVTRKIAKNSPGTRIIGLSVHKQPSYARNILSLGAKGYLTKSSPHKEIIHAINIVASGKEYVCEELNSQM